MQCMSVWSISASESRSGKPYNMSCSPVILVQDNSYRDANLTKINSLELEKLLVFHEETLLKLAEPVYSTDSMMYRRVSVVCLWTLD